MTYTVHLKVLTVEVFNVSLLLSNRVLLWSNCLGVARGHGVETDLTTALRSVDIVLTVDSETKEEHDGCFFACLHLFINMGIVRAITYNQSIMDLDLVSR